MSKKTGDPSKVKIEENYFLYNNSNMINQTFYTEPNKKIQTYELISYFNKDTQNHSNLITPKNKVKFTVREDTLRESLLFQLESIRLEKAKIEKSSDDIRNFVILVLRKNNKIGHRRQMPLEIFNEFYIGRLQKFVQYTKLNPIEISTDKNEIISSLVR